MHEDGDTRGSLQFRLAAVALAFGIAIGMGHGVARADDASETSSGAVHSTQTETDPAPRSDTGESAQATAAPTRPTSAAGDVDQKDADEPDADEPGTGQSDPKDTEEQDAEPAEPRPSTTEEPSATDDPTPTASAEPTPTTHADQQDTETPAAQPDSPTEPTRTAAVQPTAETEPADRTVGSEPRPTVESVAPAVHSLVAETTETAAATVAPSGTTTRALVTVTTPSAPQPLSPIAELLELPGRIVNAVLEIFGFTTSSDGNKTPFTLAPFNDLIFAVFRGVELLLGFDRTPAAQQVVPTETYNGPLDDETPTVAQFLNAAAAAYVLGGVPGGLVPFTVDGFQMQSTNLFSGMSAKVWVTPQRQIIIAYQGTTGGTNLLFNPLIAITQLLADMQVIFTNTTPWAFTDALDFAQRVQAEAALQGYGDERIFVTGHSLGGWEAEYVAQHTGFDGIGFESPGLNTITAGNGAGSGFVNIETYGDVAAYMSTDLPGLQPFMPEYDATGGSKPHFGSIVMIGDPAAVNPLYNSAALWGKGLLGSLIFMIDFLGNFLEHHLPGMQAYNLDVTPDPGVVTWLGVRTGPVNEGWGEFTIPELLAAASEAKVLVRA